jgi:hypothetical protein
MVKLTFARLLSLARIARAGGRTREERRSMLKWVIEGSRKIGAI